jgi:hypothetical protein
MLLILIMIHFHYTNVELGHSDLVFNSELVNRKVIHPRTPSIAYVGIHPRTPSIAYVGIHPRTPSIAYVGIHPRTSSIAYVGIHPRTPSIAYVGICKYNEGTTECESVITRAGYMYEGDLQSNMVIIK